MDQHEGDAGPSRQMGQERPERLQPSGRGAKANDQVTLDLRGGYRFGRLGNWDIHGTAPRVKIASHEADCQARRKRRSLLQYHGRLMLS
ncbi:hypothetical protein ACFPOC_11545 [Rubellimicrobium aerolatum]|uniref:Uncharacterized protein n=1 Tax=Rubellimicrobium aerolatum TaxID=490979 RepID=A0ABW0SE48_9RHOB